MKQKYKTRFLSIFLVFSILLFLYLQIQVPAKTLYISDNRAWKQGILSINEARNFYHNKDILGYIYIPGTSIHHFFVQAKDNSSYLNKNLFKKDDILGTVFMDYRNTLSDRQLNLYGHNGNTKEAPFYDLQRYKEKEFYAKNPLIYITLPKKEKRTYKIVYVIVTQKEEHMNLNVTEDKIQFFKQNSLYNKEDSTTLDDSILILQTCSYEKENTYLLIVAKEMKGDLQ